MNIVIIDGQGGQLGAQLIKEITAQFPNKRVTAIGTNAVATAAMLKAGAKMPQPEKILLLWLAERRT
jgi:hypothetical protein